jgi:diguanylate cyclase (GGDEF)-like protein
MRGNQGSERERRGFVHYSANPLDPGSLSHDSVNAVLEDSRGILWIGTDGGGLNEVRPPVREDVPLEFIRRQPGAASAAGLSDRVVTSLCEDSRGDLWIGTYTGGLNRLGRTTTGSPEQRFVHYRHEPSDEGSLSSDFVMAIHEDRLRTLWVGTIDGGLNRFDRNRDRFVRYTADDEVPGRLSDNSVFAVYEDWEARLWVGTAEGLNLLDRKTNLFTHYKNVPTDPESISSNLIRAIYQDRSGTLWIGTDGGGLNQLVAAGVGKRRPKFKAYRMRDGLPNDSVLGILEDDRGNLWLSTHRGLSRFDPSRGTFRNYDSNDGLQGNDFRGAACWKSRSGELFFGGSHGFNVFHPEQIQDNPNAPPIVILDFQLFNKSVPVQKKQEDGRVILRESISETDQIALSFRDAVFSFQFAALHYVAPHENEYAYMMEGLDRDWNFIGNRRFVTYTTLPPGDYVFRVKGANGDGVWNERGVSLRIAITPPFWKTIWFYAASLGAVLSLGITLYRLRLSQVRRREIELEGQVEERTQQLAEVNQQLNQANARLRRLATRDELTGIGNMRLFRAFYSREWRRVVRSGLPMSLIMIDVDFFKLYNDTYGHSAGDECLKKVARCIRSYANRPGDLAARYGGEEFIVVLAGMDAQDTAQLAERMRRDVESMAIPHEHSSIASRLTISLGCATLIPSREDNPDLLFKEVDTALYLSKQNGRNRTTVWPDSGGAGRRGARHKVD